MESLHGLTTALWDHEPAGVESCARMSNIRIAHCSLLIAHCSLAIEALATDGSWRSPCSFRTCSPAMNRGGARNPQPAIRNPQSGGSWRADLASSVGGRGGGS